MKTIKETAKSIVEFIYGGGDLLNEKASMMRAELGTECHKIVQSKYKELDHKEVVVSLEKDYNDYHLSISGRMDGLLKRGNKLIIDEIKSTYNDLNLLDLDTYPAHISQAKMYAYMYLLENNKKSIYIRLTYISVSDHSIKKMENKYSFEELESFFFETIDKYLEWIHVQDKHEENRNKSIFGLTFPFEEYRPGQREFMAACYKNFLNNDILYAIAPTGIGKTIATIFSALKSISHKEDKIFYLTAKNAGKKVAIDTVRLLINNGLDIKACVISNKDYMCLKDTRECDPEKCPYAKGYYTKIFNVIRALYDHEDIFTNEILKEYGANFKVCPFELALDISYYADIVIADYNYAFDPRAHLVRYFEDETYKPLLLIDEAHNMISRGREMYSASLSKLDIKRLKKLLTGIKPASRKEILGVLETFDEYETELQNTSLAVFETLDEFFLKYVEKLISKLEKILFDHDPFPTQKEALEIYYELLKFSRIAEYYDDSFVFTVEKESEDVIFSIRCLDASKFILETIKEKTFGTVFFSATLFPIEYYQKLLTKDEGNICKFVSPFNRDNLKLIAMDNISTRYQDRDKTIDTICDTINVLANSKVGNYIVFFPSYQYLSMVLEELENRNYDFEFIAQKRDFSIREKEDVVEQFKETSLVSRVYLFVMGGTFSEGIDYVGDMLSGVIIVGTGLPMYGGYNNVLKSYFDEKFNNGFDYAYTYPGLNKVIQAVGRVIRTKTDRGVAILIDDRFTSYKYKKLYPKEWNHLKVINDMKYLEKEIKEFWEE